MGEHGRVRCWIGPARLFDMTGLLQADRCLLFFPTARCSRRCSSLLSSLLFPLFCDNSGIVSKLLIMAEEIGRKNQHNSGEIKKCR